MIVTIVGYTTGHDLILVGKMVFPTRASVTLQVPEGFGQSYGAAVVGSNVFNSF